MPALVLLGQWLVLLFEVEAYARLRTMPPSSAPRTLAPPSSPRQCSAAASTRAAIVLLLVLIVAATASALRQVGSPFAAPELAASLATVDASAGAGAGAGAARRPCLLPALLVARERSGVLCEASGALLLCVVAECGSAGRVRRVSMTLMRQRYSYRSGRSPLDVEVPHGRGRSKERQIRFINFRFFSYLIYHLHREEIQVARSKKSSKGASLGSCVCCRSAAR